MADENEETDDTPKWVQNLFERLTGEIAELKEKVNAQSPAPEKEVIKPIENNESERTDDKPTPPKRKRGWIYRK